MTSEDQLILGIVHDAIGAGVMVLVLIGFYKWMMRMYDYD